MKFYYPFLLVLITLQTTLFAQCSIVYVYIAKKIPAYALQTIKQARYFNPDVPIILLANNDICFAFNDDEDLISFKKETNLQVVNTNSFEASEIHFDFLRENMLTEKWREDFWRLTSQRFFYLYDFMRHTGMKDIFHFECDVLLYEDVRNLYPKVRKVTRKLAAPFVSYSEAAASILYCRDANALLEYCKHIVHISTVRKVGRNDAYSIYSDMRTLGTFRKKYGARALATLLTLMPEYEKYYSRRDIKWDDKKTPLEFLTLNSKVFGNYIFDAASWGIYVGGYDPRNCASGPGQIHNKVIFDPSKFSFYWSHDEKGRRVPRMKFANKEYKIVNLHFHCKGLDDYLSYGKLVDRPLDPKLLN